MALPIPLDITRLLISWSDGDPSAMEQLVPVVHSELRRMAHADMRRHAMSVPHSPRLLYLGSLTQGRYSR